jgi:hypothetical protein
MKSWYELPKEIKELLTKNNAIETAHKEGKDDDMNNATRTFDDSKKGFGGAELADEGDKPKDDKGTAGEKIENEKPKGGETESRDAGRKTEGKKHKKQPIRTNPETKPDKHGHGERSETKEESEGHTRTSESMQLLSQQVSKDPEIAASDKKQEAGLQDTSAIDRQIVAHGKVQGRKEQGTKGKEIKEGVAALKAWQLWLAKREQQLLKDAQTGEGSNKPSKRGDYTPDNRSVHSRRDTTSTSNLTEPAHTADSRPKDYEVTSSGKDTGKKRVTNKPTNTFTPSPHQKEPQTSVEQADETTWDDANRKWNKQVDSNDWGKDSGGSLAPEKLTERQGKGAMKSWESWLTEQKSNPERSIHGNAGREPNSGVNTNTGFDAPKDYEGFSHSGVRPEQFKHEKLKPKVTTKERINIGSTAPSQGGQGTGDGGNPHNTRQQNKDVKGRAVSGKDRK